METRTLLEPIHPSRLNLLVEETRPEPRRESALAQERRMIDADLRSFFDSVSQYEVANNRPPKKISCRQNIHSIPSSNAPSCWFSDSGSKGAVVCNLARMRELHEFSVNAFFVDPAYDRLGSIASDEVIE